LIRAEVMGAFEFAESMRTKVMVDDSDGLLKGNGILFESKNTNETVQLLYWSRNEPGLNGRMTAALNLPRISDALLPGFDLEWRENGDWHCVSAAKHVKPPKSGKPAPAVLDAKYLPAACRDAGPMLAPKSSTSSPPSSVATPTCPADKEMVTLSTGPACTNKCSEGKVRDSTNPAACKDVVCKPDEKKGPNGACVNVGTKPDCGPDGDSHIVFTNDNTPKWSCFPKCDAGKIRDPNDWFSCIADPNAKPVAQAPVAKPASVVSAPAPVAAPAAKSATPATPPGGAAPAGTLLRPAATAQQSIQCHVCDPAMKDLCEQVTVETTCTYPNNFCITFVDNHDDGTKSIDRRCGNFRDADMEWYNGTSDDDKCRERINVQQKLAFRCTFACETGNCNAPSNGVRPPEDSLYLQR
jgi:hypothetical protein